MALIGQRFNSTAPYYIKHPSPAAETWVDNGSPLDSGTVMIFDQNWSHLSNENLRHLVSIQGWSAPGDATKNNYGYDGLVDVEVPEDPTTEPEYRQISWSRSTSIHRGPFYIPVDKVLSDGRFTIRDVVVHLGYYNAVSTSATKFYFYLTEWESPPSEGYLAGTTFSDSTINYNATRQVIECTNAYSPNVLIPSRNGGDTVLTKRVYLWVGWAMNNDNSDWRYISAFETK